MSMRVGELIPLSGTHFLSKASVPAGKAAVANLGVLGISIGIGKPSGTTSRPSVPMPKYKTIPGHTQGTK